ncbi:hypothetical protein Cgig2_028622 [Carnegiea gigantea]|uniref:Uncharacterized protein n=1 Tax=Carnegiea gigantea TaxID=171969 RepID=A0A9Q1QDG8_9CARY|nr:hypothetical protein Cgig2_028622 [Carnegiea gigantea]
MTDKNQRMGDVQMMNKAQEAHVRSGNGECKMSNKLKIKWKKVEEFINHMSPKRLQQLIENLNDKKKAGIREISFRGFQHLQADIISEKMAVWETLTRALAPCHSLMWPERDNISKCRKLIKMIQGQLCYLDRVVFKLRSVPYQFPTLRGWTNDEIKDSGR